MVLTESESDDDKPLWQSLFDMDDAEEKIRSMIEEHGFSKLTPRMVRVISRTHAYCSGV